MRRVVALAARVLSATACGGTDSSSPSSQPTSSGAPVSSVFKLNGQGDAAVKTTVQATFPPSSGTWYVVVHAGPDLQGPNAAHLLCGNLFK